MPNPHLTETGQPWKPSTYGYSGPAQPVATGTPNFGPPGTGGANQPPIVNTPIVNTVGQDTGGRPWSEDEIVGPPIVDTTPVVDTTPDNTDARSAAILASSLASAESNPYDILDAFTDLSVSHGALTNPDGTPTKYGKSWDFNPANPDNLIGMDTHTLGSFIVTDSSGNPVLDSEGKPIFTSFGKALHGQMQDEGIIGSNQEVLNEDALQDYIDSFSFEDIHGMEKDYWRDSFDQDWSGMDDFDYDYYGGGPQETASLTDPNWWQQTSLGELDPTGFADLERIYGKEFGEERIAAPHAWGIDQFSEIITEIT